MKPKFNYQSYDYSFLKPKDAYSRWGVYFPQAVRVAAQTIGFDMTPVEPMNEPVGQLFYFEPTFTATTTDDGGGQITATTAVYEPITYETLSDAITTVSNHITRSSTMGASNYAVTNAAVSRALKSTENRRREGRAKFFARRNYFKNLRSNRHG